VEEGEEKDQEGVRQGPLSSSNSGPQLDWQFNCGS
jgi:hypothetical protein